MNDLFNISMQQLIDEALVIQSSLHFIRADWFYAFIPLILFLLLSYKTTVNNKNWTGIVDPQLLPFVLSRSGSKQRRYPLLLVFIAGSLCITALAGPVYKKLPQPVYREQSSLVVLLDMSQSMNAGDIKPSRLSRAKLELLDLLKTRKTGQTALIVYAADAFAVTPLTDDNATIANMVPSLETDMMPAQGSNLSNALAKTFSLFTQAGIINGNILVITDDIHQRDKEAIKKVFSQGHRLSILGIGTDAGAPIPLDGGFLQDSDGAIVIPRLEPAKLQSYALSGGGLYSSLQADDSDIDKLSRLFESSEISQDINNKDLNADIWQEEGHWLLLPLVLFAALWARKGWLAVQLLFAFSLLGPMTQPAYADVADGQTSIARNIIDWKNLWSSPDQKAMKAFDAGDNKKAAENFTRPDWKASAQYREGDFAATAKTLENTDSSDGFYNRGNALARLGKLEDAIKAYDRALEIDESNDDASYNREQVQQALEKQQQESEQQNSQKQDEKQQDNQQQEQSQDSQQENQQDAEQQQQKDSEQQDSEQSESQNDQEQQKSSEKSEQQQQMEQQELKQRDADAEAEQQKKEQQQYQQDENEARQQEEQQPDTAEKEVEHQDMEEKPMDVEINPMEASITEEEKATEQWLKRIPDDPGGLLRRKFYYQYKQIPNQKDSEQPW